jgi:hypothetical protein
MQQNPTGVYNIWQERKAASQKVGNGVPQGIYPVPIGMRLGSKRRGNMVNQTVVSIVKKELLKRNESPRSRRQMINNLAIQ